MFQDEGRFGLLGDPQQCWAPKGIRPVVGARLLRQFTYAFSALSPHDGEMDSLVLPFVNAETMSLFLALVAARHPGEFILMVMDQAGWHIADALQVPYNMRILFLPPYSPELNPVEHLWKILRQTWFANTVFSGMRTVVDTLCTGIRTLEADPERVRSFAGFDWITSISLNAT